MVTRRLLVQVVVVGPIVVVIGSSMVTRVFSNREHQCYHHFLTGAAMVVAAEVTVVALGWFSSPAAFSGTRSLDLLALAIFFLGNFFGPHASDPVFTTSSSDSGGSNHAL